MSVVNTTYNSAEIPLSFIVNDEVSKLAFSIDNQANITINGNTTLTGLAGGSHSIVVYANDTAGNMGKSDVFFFTIDAQPSLTPTIIPSLTPSVSPTQQPTLEPSPTLDNIQAEDYTPIAIIVGLVIAVIVVMGVLIYLKKRRG